MRYCAHVLIACAALMLTGCGTITLGDNQITPEQRCVGYTVSVARYERILAEEGELSSAQRALYDIALAGQAATCPE